MVDLTFAEERMRLRDGSFDCWTGKYELRDNRFDFSTERYETQGRYICLLHREV